MDFLKKFSRVLFVHESNQAVMLVDQKEFDEMARTRALALAKILKASAAKKAASKKATKSKK